MSNFVQAQKFILHSNASISDTTVTVKDFVGLDGSNLTLADFGTKGFATLNPGVANAEEAISFTGVTQNGDGTATLTGVSTQLTESPYTETSGLAKSHISGATFVLSNTAGFYDHNFLNKNESQTVSGLVTFADGVTPQVATAATDPTNDAEFIHKKFADEEYLHLDGSVPMSGDLVMDGNDINMAAGGRILNLTDAVDPQEPATLAQLTGSIAGAPPNASETVKGVVEEATQAEMNAGTDTGATGAKLFVPPSKILEYIADFEVVKSQMLFTDGILFETDESTSPATDSAFDANNLPISENSILLWDDSQNILILMNAIPLYLGGATTTISFWHYRSFVMDDQYRVQSVVNARLQASLAEISTHGKIHAHIKNGYLYVGSLRQDSTPDFVNIDSYTIGSDGVISSAVDKETAFQTTGLNDFDSIVGTDSVVIALGEIDTSGQGTYREFSTASGVMTSAGSGTFDVVDSDGTTAITSTDFGTTELNWRQVGDYFVPVDATSYKDGFVWDNTGKKMVRTATLTYGDDKNIYDAENRRLQILTERFIYDASNGFDINCMKSCKLNVYDRNSVTITTL